MRVLVVEDDEIIQEGLKYALTGEGYDVITASKMSEALEIIEQEKTDFYLLDIMLPDGDGYQICRKIREKEQTPILFLTACDDEVNTVMALEIGADDYIAKPFRVRELLARMKAILRRTDNSDSNCNAVVKIGKCKIDLQTAKAYSDEGEIALTAMEYKLLLVFLNHRGQNLSRKQILEHIWDEAGDYVNDNTLSVYIKRLRQKLGDTEESQVIKTIRGIGYRMEK